MPPQAALLVLWLLALLLPPTLQERVQMRVQSLGLLQLLSSRQQVQVWLQSLVVLQQGLGWLQRAPWPHLGGPSCAAAAAACPGWPCAAPGRPPRTQPPAAARACPTGAPWLQRAHWRQHGGCCWWRQLALAGRAAALTAALQIRVLLLLVRKQQVPAVLVLVLLSLLQAQLLELLLALCAASLRALQNVLLLLPLLLLLALHGVAQGVAPVQPAGGGCAPLHPPA